MESKKKYFLEPCLRLVDQKNDLEVSFPGTIATISNGVLVWIGNVRPSPLSKLYKLKIEYRIGKSPKVWLVGEKLNPETYMNIPHKYNVNLDNGEVQLCLYKPGRQEWMKHYPLSKTIVQWAIEWLYFYEIWQVTSQWRGGGEHPSAKACKNSDKYNEKAIDRASV